MCHLIVEVAVIPVAANYIHHCTQRANRCPVAAR